jgi:hypothetical protein
MGRRWIVVSLAAGLLACTDSVTAPDSQASESRPLTLPEYALQLRGDPFLASVSGMLGRGQLADDIDATIVASQGGLDGSDIARASVATARMTLMSVLGEDTEVAPTETDILTAVVTVTLDRIAQINAESASISSEPPPSR